MGDPADRAAATARTAVGLARVAVVSFAAAPALFGAAVVIGGGQDAVSDNAVGVLVAVLGFAGLLAGVGAFVLAVVAGVRGARWGGLAFALAALPVMLALLILGEVLWWE